MELHQDKRTFKVVGDGFEDKKISTAMTYKRKNSHFMPNPDWGIVRLYNEKTKTFPIGLLSKFPYQSTVHFKMPFKAFNFELDNIRDYQIKALEAMQKSYYGVLQMPTGSGKTRVATIYIKAFNESTLVLVPTIDLKTQWKSQVPEHVHVQTYAAVKKKEYIQSFNLVIFDECHHVAAKTLYKIGMNLKETAYVFGLSATPFNRDDDNMKVEAVLGPIIYKITTEELIQTGYLCNAEVIFHKIPMPLTPFYLDPLFMDYKMTYHNYITNNFERNALIIKLAIESKGKVLILVNRVEHGQKLLELLSGHDVVFIHGSLSQEERAKNHARIIIATSIYDEGIDMPELETLIIAAGGKSSIKTTQRVGRLLRNSPGKTIATVHDFLDEAKWLSTHAKKRMEILQRDFLVRIQKDKF